MAWPAPAAAVLRRFPVVVAGAILGAALAAVAAARLPSLYEAEAALLVELAPDFGEAFPAVSFDASGLVPLLEQRIRARAVSAEVAARLAAARPSLSQAGAAPSESVTAGSGEAPSPAPTNAPEEAQARIVTLELRAPRAQLAAAAANELVTLLLREAAERRRAASEPPATPAEDIERLARELEARGAALRAFVTERAEALPDSLQARRLQLAAEEERLAELARAEAALAAPAEPKGAASPAEGAGRAEEVDSHRTLVDSQRAEAEARIAELRQSIEATPVNAAALSELRQEFEALRSEFERTTQTRFAAEAADLVALLSGSPRVSVLALAAPPMAPANRNRPLIMAAGTAGGLLLGLALALLLDARDRSIRHPEELAIRLGLEPFAAIPVLRSRRARGRRVGLAALFAVLVLAAALWAIHLWVVPLDRLVGRLLIVAGATGPGGG